MFVCPHCQFNATKRGDWKRHEQSAKHAARVGLETQRKALEDENTQLRTLVLEQQAQLKMEQGVRPSRMKKEKDLQDCAIGWSEFLDTVSVEDTGARDVTSAIATTLLKALHITGPEKSPLQCLDAKRKKMRLKLEGQWVVDPTKVYELLCGGADTIRYQLMQKAQEWRNDHPFWFENEAETELFAQRMQLISAEIDYDRYISIIAAKSVKA